MPGLSVSAAASAAIQNLARSLAVEWAADNIRCNVVACGMIEGRDDPAFAMAAQRGIAPGDTVPTGQIGTVADVVAARSEEHTSELQSLMRISYAVFCLKTKTDPKSNNQHRN